MKRVNIALVTAVAALIALPLGVAPASAADEEIESNTQAIVDMPKTASMKRSSAESFWTPERMLAAEPIELEAPPENTKAREGTATPQQRLFGESVIVEPSDSSKPSPMVKVGTERIPGTMGKIFSTAPNGTSRSCSGTVVNSRGKNLMITAAHCVYNKDPELGPDGWHTDIMFAPGYHMLSRPTGNWPVTPFGLWDVEGASVMQGWTQHHEHDYDQAIVALEANANGKEVVDLVGGNGLKRDASQTQSNPISIWGYAFYDQTGAVALKPNLCSETTSPSGVIGSGMKADCWMSHGASGGPWIKDPVDQNRGYIFGVTSFRATVDGETDESMHSVRVNGHTQDLYVHRTLLNGAP